MKVNKKILIVDDSDLMRSLIRQILESVGYREFAEADNGSAALDILESQQVDIIISDWIMPELSGIELLKIVRANRDFDTTPFLMLTVEALDVSRETALAHGASDFLAKPFTVQGLIETVSMLLEKDPKD